MALAALTILTSWYQHLEILLPIAVAVLSVAILFGCAIMSWIAPSEKTDCLFHREVI